MSEQLKPCPFCGGEAERTTLEEEGRNFGGDVITCKRCFASSHVEFGLKENLSSHWNTRTDLSRAPDLAALALAGRRLADTLEDLIEELCEHGGYEKCEFKEELDVLTAFRKAEEQADE